MAVISPNVSSDLYTANGIVTEFAFPFSVVSADDVLVLWDGAPHGSGYGVTFGDLAGTVIFETPPPAGTKIRILLDPDYLQTSEFADQGAYNLSTVNTINRRAAIKALVTEDKANRALKMPYGEGGGSLPAAADRVETLLGFDDTGAAAVYAVAPSSLATIESIAGAIVAVDANAANINAVFANAANINTVSGIAANVTTVAGIAANVTTVAGMSAAITTVNGNATNINTVATNIAAVNTVATNIAAVTTCATNIAAINLVSGSIANVNLTGGSIANVDLVGPNIASVTTVAANIGSIAVAANDRFLLDSINRLSVPGTDTRIGYQSNSATGSSNLNNNTLAYVGTSDIIQTLSILTTDVTAVNSGAADLVIMTGIQAAPIYKSKVALPPAALVGFKTWTAADFGAITLAVGDMVWINSPSSTGFQQNQPTVTGNTLRYVLGPAAFSVGASPGSLTANPNRQLRAWFNTPSKDLSLDSAHMSAAVRSQLGVVDLITGTGSVKAGYQGALLDGATGSNFSGTGLLVHITTATVAATMTALEVYCKTFGASTVPTLVIAIGDVAAPVYKSVTTLPGVNSVGIKVWTAADFGTINLAVGDMVFLHLSTNGITLGKKVLTGNALYYKTGISTPVYPGSASGLTTDASSQIAGRIRYAGTVPAVPDEYLSATDQFKLALLPDGAPTTFRIFVGVGQSNIVGLGDAGLSPAIPAGRAYQYYSSALTAILGDTVGNATAGAGTIWPSFANTFFAKSSEGVIIVPAAVGGTGLAGGGVGDNWSPAGGLRGAAITALNAAIAACNAAGVLWSFGGFIWGQGESDADRIATGGTAYTGGTLTAAMYETALGALVTYFQGQMTGICNSSEMPFIIQKLGTRNTVDAAYDAAYASIQAAQVNVARSLSNVHMGYAGAPNFRTRGLMRDANHYFQQGYNECGAGNAIAAANICIGLA